MVMKKTGNNGTYVSILVNWIFLCRSLEGIKESDASILSFWQWKQCSKHKNSNHKSMQKMPRD